jgi:hypothetical protein
MLHLIFWQVLGRVVGGVGRVPHPVDADPGDVP